MPWGLAQATRHRPDLAQIALGGHDVLLRYPEMLCPRHQGSGIMC